MAAVKFFLVAAWYMHMKQRPAVVPPVLRRRASSWRRIVYGIVLLVFSSTVLKS